jgi:hypothetical protein
LLFHTLIKYDTISLSIESGIFLLNPDISIPSYLFGVKKTTVLVAAVLAAILTVGLTVPPTPIQDAQANPCANEISRGGSADNAFIPQDDDERECDFTGYFDFEEEIDSEDIPPVPLTGAFTINGEASGTIACPGAGEGPAPADVSISVTGEESGTVTGSVIFVLEGGTLTLDVTGGTTDGNTFSVSGTGGVCVGAFTVSGDCGNDVMISYEDTDGIGTFTGDVECTLL